MKAWRSVAVAAAVGWGAVFGAAKAQDAEQVLQAFAQSFAQDDLTVTLEAGRAVLAVDVPEGILTAAEMRDVRADIAELFAESGDIATARSVYQELLAELEAEFGPNAFALVDVLARLSDLSAETGELTEASAYLDRAIAISRMTINDAAPAGLVWLLEARNALDARILAEEGDRAPSVIEARITEREESIEDIEEEVRSRRQRISTLGPDDVDGLPEADEDSNMEEVRLYYGTSRARRSSTNLLRFYGNATGALELGVVDVSVRRNDDLHWMRRVTGYTFQVLNEDGVRFVLEDIAPMAAADFFEDVRGVVSDSDQRELFIYVHGYNTSFADAAGRAAQLTVDLEIDGASAFYSWPSRGSALSYWWDQSMDPSVYSDMRQFIVSMIENSGAERVHVLAYSMGNYHVMRALEGVNPDSFSVDRERPIDQLVFARPDIEAGDFIGRLPGVAALARQATLYASEHDRWLELSEFVNPGGSRAGDADNLTIVEGLDTIDTTRIRERFESGHEIRPLRNDLRGLFWFDLETSDRCTLIEARSEAGTHWNFLRPDDVEPGRCDENVYRHAAIMARRAGCESAISATRGRGVEWSPVLDYLESKICGD